MPVAETFAETVPALWRSVKPYMKVWVVGFIAGATVMGVGTWFSSRADSDETAERFVKLIESSDLMEAPVTKPVGTSARAEEPLDVKLAKTGYASVEAIINGKSCFVEAHKGEGLFLVAPINVGCNFKPGNYIKP